MRAMIAGSRNSGRNLQSGNVGECLSACKCGVSETEGKKATGECFDWQELLIQFLHRAHPCYNCGILGVINNITSSSPSCGRRVESVSHGLFSSVIIGHKLVCVLLQRRSQVRPSVFQDIVSTWVCG